ncbi:hypothetical protein [Flavobacterium sp.]|uniref:DUF7677 family protein n=1 Tax=Flavobacterium sp. TaxID=239 RepID=UPI0039E614E0
MKPFDARKGKKLSHDITADLRFFGYYIGNETLLLPSEQDMTFVYEQSEALGHLFGIKLFGSYEADGNHREQTTTDNPILEYAKSHNQKPMLPFSIKEIRESKNWRAVITRFMLDLGNRKLDTIPLKDYQSDYADEVIDYGNSMEMLTAIFCNVLRMDNENNVINEDWARHRASQYIRSFKDESYAAKPRFKTWETWLWL